MKFDFQGKQGGQQTPTPVDDTLDLDSTDAISCPIKKVQVSMFDDNNISKITVNNEVDDSGCEEQLLELDNSKFSKQLFDLQ